MLTSKQRAQLRGLANGIDTILIVGKEGIGDNLVKQANDALEARELVAFACGKDHYAHSIIQHTRPDCNLRTNLNRFTLKKLHFFHREMDRG